MKAYRTTPEYRAKHNEYMRKWVQENPDKVKAIRDRHQHSIKFKHNRDRWQEEMRRLKEIADKEFSEYDPEIK